jgi:hypothetical protein
MQDQQAITKRIAGGGGDNAFGHKAQPIAIGFNQPPAGMLKAGIKPKDANRARCHAAILADQPRQGFMEAWC